jgi:YD repeat-containing protein
MREATRYVPLFRRRTVRSAAAVVGVGLFAAAGIQPARAEAPVNQCTDSGQSSSSSGGAGSGFSPGPNLGVPTALGTPPSLGTVSAKTGAFTLTNEDLSLGSGAFPAKLTLQRTYSSDQDGPTSQDYDRDAPYEPGARQPMPFGRGATHNLDVRYEQIVQSFGGKFYIVILLRMGAQAIAFQKCGDGTFLNTRGDGSRLYVDSTYPSGGYRYETRTGDVLLFQSLPSPSSGTYYCTKSTSTKCGVLRKWTSPNGDWAQFDYEQFYSHPSNRAEPSYSGYMTQSLFNAGTTECHPNFSGASECHQRLYATSYVAQTSGTAPPIPSFPVYNWRVTKVSNSRGYEIRLQYVDQTTDVGGTCTDVGGYLNCSPAKNTGLGRSRIQTATAYWTSPAGVSTQTGQTGYAYSDCQSWTPNCLATVTATDGSITTFNYSYGQTNSLSIIPPGQTAPVTTLTFALGVGSYYYRDMIRGAYLPQKLYQNYYRVTAQSFVDGSSVQYTPTLANKWVAEASGMWDWPEYISAMRVVQGTAATNYGFVDAVDDHNEPVTVVNPLNAPITNTYNAVGALQSTTLPEGNRTTFSYDVRGNLLSMTRYPKTGSLDDPLVETNTYGAGPTVAAASCPNQLLCNRPSTHVDAGHFQTDYGWDAATGLSTSETAPADATGLRPTVTYTYGSYAGASSSTIRLLNTKTQQIDATRSQITTFGYDNDIKLAPKEATVSGGDLTLRTCYKTDLVGNLISQTNPRSNLSSCP